MNEATLNEAETRAELIDPALQTAGWGVLEHSRVRREAIYMTYSPTLPSTCHR